MSVQHAWGRFLQNKSDRFVGGDIEHRSHQEGTFRGRISSIAISDGWLVITTHWTARLYVDCWKAVETRVFRYPIAELSWPNNGSEKMVLFSHGSCKVALYIGNLDPSMVEGLQKN